jgi:hypothetical protein
MIDQETVSVPRWLLTDVLESYARMTFLVIDRAVAEELAAGVPDAIKGCRAHIELMEMALAGLPLPARREESDG